MCLCVYVYINMSDNESMLPPAGPEAEESPLRKITRRYIIQSYYAKERRDTQNNTEHSGHRKIMDADRDIAMGTIAES